MDTTSIPATPAASGGAVTTFYAYDGGPARSLALVHAAWQLAGRDASGGPGPVLMIDWDLAGPGLHHVFPGLANAADDAAQERAGVLELFEACRERLRACARPGTEDADALAARVLDGLDWDAHIERVDDARPLYLMRAGRLDDSYGERVDGFDWDALFRACPALFRGFAAYLTGRFAHVLIDCGSGRSAATSVCTALLPDRMVGLFTPDLRSLDGLRGVVARALDYRCSHEDDQRPLLVYPLPSPVESGGEGRLRWRFGGQRHAEPRRGEARDAARDPGYQTVLENLLGDCYGISSLSLDSYLDEVQLPMATVLGAPLPCNQAAAGAHDRLGAARCVATLLEWLEPGHFPWRPLAEVRLLGAVDALGARAADPEAPDQVRELARLAQAYLGQQGELDAARRIEQHVIALEQGMHAMEEGQRPGLAGSVRRAAHAGAADGAGTADAPGSTALGDKLSRLQELIDSRSPREARTLADSLRSTILGPSVAHPLRRRGAAMIKQVYLQAGDMDALLAFTQDEVSTLEGALIEAAGGGPLVPG